MVSWVNVWLRGSVISPGLTSERTGLSRAGTKPLELGRAETKLLSEGGTGTKPLELGITEAKLLSEGGTGTKPLELGRAEAKLLG